MLSRFAMECMGYGESRSSRTGEQRLTDVLELTRMTLQLSLISPTPNLPIDRPLDRSACLLLVTMAHASGVRRAVPLPQAVVNALKQDELDQAAAREDVGEFWED
jgi:hypothetical protein